MSDDDRPRARTKLPGRRASLALGVAALGAAAVAMYVAFSGGGGEEQLASGPEQQADEKPQTGVLDPFRPEVGQPAPDFALIDVRDGKTVRKLSDYRGKTVVLNWYASWCSPCQKEIPDFQAAYTALDGEVVFLLLNLQESRDRAAGMLASLGATFPAVLDSEGAVANHYRLLGMPTTFFIDREGIVRSSGTGLITAEALREELGKLGHSY